MMCLMAHCSADTRYSMRKSCKEREHSIKHWRKLSRTIIAIIQCYHSAYNHRTIWVTVSDYI